MERELRKQIQHNNRLQAELDKRETIIRQLSESQHRQLPEQEERGSRDNHSRVGPPSSNTLHVKPTMTQSADDTRTNVSTSRTLGNVTLQILDGKSQSPMQWWTLFLQYCSLLGRPDGEIFRSIFPNMWKIGMELWLTKSRRTLISYGRPFSRDTAKATLNIP